MMGSEAAESEAFDKAGWFNPNFLQPSLAKNSSPVHYFFDHSTRMRLSLKQCFVAEDALCLFSASIAHQARCQGVQWGKLPPTIPNVALAIFRIITLLMCKPKKCVSAYQRNCQKHYFTSTFSRTWWKQYGLSIPHDYSNIVCSVNAGEFMQCLAFTQGLTPCWSGHNEIQFFIYALVISKRK